jgi:endoglucanase
MLLRSGDKIKLKIGDLWLRRYIYGRTDGLTINKTYDEILEFTITNKSEDCIKYNEPINMEVNNKYPAFYDPMNGHVILSDYREKENFKLILYKSDGDNTNVNTSFIESGDELDIGFLDHRDRHWGLKKELVQDDKKVDDVKFTIIKANDFVQLDRIINYNDTIVLKDVNNKYLSERLKFDDIKENALQLTIRPENLNEIKGQLPTNSNFHLQHNNKYITNNNNRLDLGEDSYIKLYYVDSHKYVTENKEYGLSILNSMAQNQSENNDNEQQNTSDIMLNGNGEFKKNGIYVKLEYVATSKPHPNIFELNRLFGKGVNAGGALESPKGENWGALPVLENDFALISGFGFTNARIPVRWDPYCYDGSYILQSDWIEKVKKVVNWALKYNLYVMVNIHHFDDMIKEPNKYYDKYISIMWQLSYLFKDYGNKVFFELFNEPHLKLNDEWNRILLDGFRILRKYNRTRACIIGPAGYNGRARLPELILPKDDRNIIVTVHYYEPMNFTHNECPYSYLGHPDGYRTHWGTQENYAKVFNDFKGIAKIVKDKFNLPVNIGEFGTLPGAVSHRTRPDGKISPSDMVSRKEWARTVAVACKYNDFSFCYFDLRTIWAYDHPQFALYDNKKKEWIGGIAKAIIEA